MKYLVIISLTLLSFQAIAQKIGKSDLLGCWTDSREENIPGSNISVYRPCDYKVFPASRYRLTMTLKGDSRCSWLVLASNDGHYMADGTWSYNESTHELKLYDRDGKEVMQFVIEEVGDKMLKMKNRVP